MKSGGKRLSAEWYVLAALVMVSFLLLFFSTLSFVVDVKNVGLSLFSGMRGGVNVLSNWIGGTINSIEEVAQLRRDYDELASRIERYEQLERSAAEIRQENNRLREQLGFSRQIGYRHIAAEVIGRDPDNLFSSLVINRGKRHGVDYNMPVIAFQDGLQVLVGKVVQAAQFESLVMPVYDMSSFVPARFAASRYDGLVEGQGRGNYPLYMRLISKRAREEIGQGDMVVTSGISGAEGEAVYPPGLNVGRVSRVLYREDETSMEAELEGAADFSRLEFVFVIDKIDASDGGAGQ
ncbi:MAG: rod shape-determining protein MreC [Spirochaetaceae bacterium]|jgi:rod shape-determining protein MreC|nr:rod shape-determining protein MreC [Spirochaetaceae bacterium]